MKPKTVSGRAAPGPAGGAYNTPPDPLAGWEGLGPLPNPPHQRKAGNARENGTPQISKRGCANDVAYWTHD